MLTTIGLAAPQFEVGVSERDILIRLKDAARGESHPARHADPLQH